MSKKVLRYDEHGQPVWVERGADRGLRTSPLPCVDTMSLGFTTHDFETMEADRKLHGHSGIEFVKDPEIPWYNVKADSPQAMERWAEHRDQPNGNGRNGGGRALSPDNLKEAEQRIRTKYGERK